MRTGKAPEATARERLAPPHPERPVPIGALGRCWERPRSPEACCGFGARCVCAPLSPPPRVAPSQQSRAGRPFSTASRRWITRSPAACPSGWRAPSCDTEATVTVSAASPPRSGRACPVRSGSLPAKDRSTGATPGWDGSAHPNPPRATLGTEIGGSLRSRPQVPARHRDPGDRSTTAKPPATCGIGGVPIRNAFPRTSTPVSHVTLWIGIGRVENRLQFTAPCPRSGSTSVAGKAPRYRHDFRKDPTRSDALVWPRWPLSAKFPVCRSCSPSSKGIE